MKITVSKWGNSWGVRIPKPFSKELEINEGDALEISLVKGGILLKKPKYHLKELLKTVNKKTRHAEFETGAKTGNEIW